MGREETMSCTRFVPSWICWLCYLCTFAVVAMTFLALPVNAGFSRYFTGFMAHMMSTICIFFFSFVCSNTSLYDPAWVALPAAIGIAYVASAPSLPSARGCYALGLIFVWWIRYQLWFPWDGWYKGIHTEDWRYVKIAEITGEGTPLYWFASLVSLHLTPTLLVWVGLTPVIPVWTIGQEGAVGLGLWDVVAVTLTLASLVIQAVSDEQLRRFRETQYGTGANLNTSTSSRAILRDGLWAYSRHPNYFGEASFWLGMACIGMAGRPYTERFWISTTDNMWRAASVSFCWGGALVMFGFFRVSAHLTDQRMLERRGEAYKQVMNEVNALVPFFPLRKKKVNSE